SPQPQDTVSVVVLPSPGRAPARPSDLKGEPIGLGPETASAAYVAHLFQSFTTAGGAIPAHKVGTDPVTGADRYISDISPKDVFTAGETNTLGAVYVAATPLQVTYVATFDMDLAPRARLSGTEPFTSDNFTALSQPDFDPSINSNSQGFKQEDSNYSLVASHWQNTRA